MKKSIVVIFTVFIFAFLLGACAGTPIAFDESLADNEVAIIHYTGVDIVEYNGIPLSWKAPLFSSLVIRIPGGNTSFVLNGTTGSYNIGYTTYRQTPFTFNFESGREYTMYINQYLILIYEGKSTSRKNHIATYNMTRGQTLIMSKGERV